MPIYGTGSKGHSHNKAMLRKAAYPNIKNNTRNRVACTERHSESKSSSGVPEAVKQMQRSGIYMFLFLLLLFLAAAVAAMRAHADEA